jgi:uncharacterized membrane protein YphA (DoxX/SURF4 family)
MAIDRQGTGLTIVRVFMGVFFIFMGVRKYPWFLDTSILAGQFDSWLETNPPGTISHWYLEHMAIPGLAVFARLVPLGELVSGVALLVGFWTPLFAFIAFFMVLNFAVASGLIFTYGYLTNGYGLPVLGSTLGLAVGGVRTKWSIR